MVQKRFAFKNPRSRYVFGGVMHQGKMGLLFTNEVSFGRSVSRTGPSNAENCFNSIEPLPGKKVSPAFRSFDQDTCQRYKFKIRGNYLFETADKGGS